MSKIDIDRLDELNIELPEEFDGLPTFVVGGAIRDKLTGAEVSDHDLMVAEVSPSEMRERGFHEIDSPNNDTFAVFHDSLNREVAIAREESPKETPDGDGNPHTSFDIEPVPEDVPATEAVQRDSKRRDITINSLVFDLRHDVLHDPNNGLQDLEDGVIRAVDHDSFKTDPLRIIRAARFASRLDFEIETTTKKLMEESADRL
jgi:tRNA nucleotidyltransferase (CCA-adding enzyme)